MSEPDEDMEAKLLAILDQPDLVENLVDATEKVVAEEEGKLTEEQRATLQTLLEAGMPSPEEIMQSAQCAEHNAKIRAKREADLAMRRERRAKGLRPKKSKKCRR